MILEIVTRVDLTFPRLKVRIETIFLRSATRKMLHHCHDTGVGEHVDLKTSHVSSGHF